MILESPLTAYFHTDFCLWVTPTKPGPQSRDTVGLCLHEGHLTGHKITLGEFRLQTLQVFRQM